MVSRALQRRQGVRESLLHTGQHYDANMSDVFFAELTIPAPVWHLGIGSSTPGEQTGRMLQGIEQVLLEQKPDWVLVYGDTNSTLAGALAASKLHIPVAHVEAGLRSFNRCMPEEANRVLTDHAADLLFAPTDVAVANLSREGIPEERIVRTGDVMCDAALFFGQFADRRTALLDQLGVAPKQYVLATVHRAENTDDPERLRNIFAGLEIVARELPVLLPLHPRTREMLRRSAITSGERVHIVAPVGYVDMLMLERNAKVIMTDSGGVQKEAFFARVPCVTLRDETEWKELVEHGCNQLAGTDPQHIAAAARRALGTKIDPSLALYGDGKTAEAIVDEIAAIRVPAHVR